MVLVRVDAQPIKNHDDACSFEIRAVCVLQLARADSGCPSSSPRMIRSCGLGLVPSRCPCKRQVGALHLGWDFVLASTDCVHEWTVHIVSVGSMYQLWVLPCVSQVCSPQTRTIGCLPQKKMPASSWAIGMLLRQWHSTTFHRRCQLPCLLAS